MEGRRKSHELHGKQSMPLCLIEASYINNIMSDRLVDLFWYHRENDAKNSIVFLRNHIPLLSS